jgi:hypothetical protein
MAWWMRVKSAVFAVVFEGGCGKTGVQGLIIG